MTNEELRARWGLSSDELENLRDKYSGTYHAVVRDVDGVEVDRESVGNIVTNEGLNYVLTSALDGGTAITAWKVALSKSTTAPAAGMTYATPSFTEVASGDVTETVRQAWTGGAVATQSVDNSTSQAVYTATTNAPTAYGAGLVGGGSASTTIANTAGGGTLYSYAKFATSKALSATDTISITYTFTSADDGV